MLSAKAPAKVHAVQLLERVMGQLVAWGGTSSSAGSRNYKPHAGWDVSLHELQGAFEVGPGW